MLIILDRDGVINWESHEYIKSPDEWLPLPGSLEAIAQLKKSGHTVVCATNQSGIGRGLFTEKTLFEIHNKMNELLLTWGVALDGIFYCPHVPDDHCQCRKPQPGLFLQIQEQLQMDLTQAFCVGDSLRDLQAATKVGSQPVLVLTGNGKTTQEQWRGEMSLNPTLQPLPTYKDLASFVTTLQFS